MDESLKKWRKGKGYKNVYSKKKREKEKGGKVKRLRRIIKQHVIRRGVLEIH